MTGKRREGRREIKRAKMAILEKVKIIAKKRGRRK